ncbi:hypothetical protein [Pontitalea aquivivens]|uniref:hypothetical protein n=1 Tax=Pontitalea aquivivens TaxID=3388663 RepID=UPI003970CC22
MAWTTIPDSVFEIDKPGRAVDMRALRDNPIAIAEGASGAPTIKAGWYPFDMVTVGDGADGLLWSHAATGNVSAVTTPTFEAGWEYLLYAHNLNYAGGAGILELWLETSATWVSVGGGVLGNNLQVHIYAPGIPTLLHNVSYLAGGSNPAGAVNPTKQAHTRVRLRSSSTLAAGQIYLYKRGGLIT